MPKTKKSPKRFVSVIFFYVLLEAGRSDLLEVLQRAAVRHMDKVAEAIAIMIKNGESGAEQAKAIVKELTDKYPLK